MMQRRTARPWTKIDQEIYACLEAPRSFFLRAAAGAGKTGSLTAVLDRLRQERREEFYKNASGVAVITFTNAAADEIRNRLRFDEIFHITTIHSFSWDLIKPFQDDIRKWIRNQESSNVEKLDTKERDNKKKLSQTDTKSRERSQTRLARLNSIRRFTYEPNGANSDRDSLNHSEVLKIAAEFLQEKPLMSQVLVRKYPILLIDECQDTNKDLIEAFLSMQVTHAKVFTLGLFGDMMQRIFPGGKKDLVDSLPEDWVQPENLMNHRCSQRVVRLLNKIRDDGIIQKPRADAPNGCVRIFLLPTQKDNELEAKQKLEMQIQFKMAEITDDIGWQPADGTVKILALEHRMAAARLSFSRLWDALQPAYRGERNFLEGRTPWAAFFRDQLFALIDAVRNDDQYRVAEIVRRHSPLLDRNNVRETENQMQNIRKARDAVTASITVFESEDTESLRSILQAIIKSRLLNIPAIIEDAMMMENASEDKDPRKESANSRARQITAWAQALDLPMSEMRRFIDYVADRSRFGTHQGVKGLEFPRVMVIMDDSEAKSNLFSFDKLHGARKPSEKDLQNQKIGEEWTGDRTQRLLYVTCSRARDSLALVYYSENPDKVRDFVTKNEWFTNDEILTGADLHGLPKPR